MEVPVLAPGLHFKLINLGFKYQGPIVMGKFTYRRYDRPDNCSIAIVQDGDKVTYSFKDRLHDDLLDPRKPKGAYHRDAIAVDVNARKALDDLNNFPYTGNHTPMNIENEIAAVKAGIPASRIVETDFDRKLKSGKIVKVHSDHLSDHGCAHKDTKGIPYGHVTTYEHPDGHKVVATTFGVNKKKTTDYKHIAKDGTETNFSGDKSGAKKLGKHLSDLHK